LDIGGFVDIKQNRDLRCNLTVLDTLWKYFIVFILRHYLIWLYFFLDIFFNVVNHTFSDSFLNSLSFDMIQMTLLGMYIL